MKKLAKIAFCIVFALLISSSVFAEAVAETAKAPEKTEFTVNVTIPADFEGELNGRLLFVIDYDIPRSGKVFSNIDVTGCPVFGKTVYGLHAGDVITMTASDPDVYGYPMQLSEIPAGEYAVQALFVVYTQFNRADGVTLWGMEEHGGGGSVTNNPYNYYTDAMMAEVNDEATIELTLNHMIELGYELEEGQVDHQGNPKSNYDCVVFDKIKSDCLSEFWGTDVYIGLNILLPVNYDPAKKYPVLYYQGHWVGSSAPCSYGRSAEFTNWWNSGDAPEIIIMTTRDANMYYDNMYWVNSANMGPCGDAFINEVIPYMEETYGGISETWARLVAGGSNGGWESMALQCFYPDVFGGAWVFCPDGMSFHAYQIVDLYKASNGFYVDQGWMQCELPSARSTDGTPRWTIAQENHWETALSGGPATSLGCWSGWEAVYGPVGEDGYPQRVWDPVTGDINKDTVAYWQEHFDILYYLENNWSEVGPKLVGKLHLRGGEMDNYYLNLSQYLVEDFLESTTEPYYDGYSVHFFGMGHTSNMSNIALLQEATEHMIKYGPANAAEILGVSAN